MNVNGKLHLRANGRSEHLASGSGEDFLFLSPEWISAVSEAVESAKTADIYFRSLVSDLTLGVVYIIRKIPSALRPHYGGSQRAVISVRLRSGVLERIEIGSPPPDNGVHLTVTTDYDVAKGLFLGEMSPALTLMSRRVQAKPAPEFRQWPKLAAKSLITASKILRTARKIPTVFDRRHARSDTKNLPS